MTGWRRTWSRYPRRHEYITEYPCYSTKLHVVIKAIEPAESGDTWSVTFETEGEEMQAPTAPGMKRPLLGPGDTALVFAKVSQAGDLLITSITPDRPVDRSPGSTQDTLSP